MASSRREGVWARQVLLLEAEEAMVVVVLPAKAVLEMPLTLPSLSA